MTKDKLLQIVGWRLGDRDDMVQRAEAELDLLQETVLESQPWQPWFLVSEMSSALTIPDERRLALPVDFLAEMEESNLYILLADGTPAKPLVKKSLELVEALYPQKGMPLAYSVTGNFFHFGPIPDQAYQVQMQYYAKVSLISDGTGVSPWLEHASDVVLAELCAVLAGQHLKDATAAAGFQADASRAWTRLQEKNTARMEVNQSRALGGNS